MQEHSEIGERILAKVEVTPKSRDCRHHHERVDGVGYPEGSLERFVLDSSLSPTRTTR